MCDQAELASYKYFANLYKNNIELEESLYQLCIKSNSQDQCQEYKESIDRNKQAYYYIKQHVERASQKCSKSS